MPIKKKSILWISCAGHTACTESILQLLRSDEEVEIREAHDDVIRQSGAWADLVVLDSGRKPEACLQVLADLKKNHPDIPVLFFSDLASGACIASALRFGARDYIIKSTNIFYIQRLVQNVLESKRQSAWT